ncbi:helix-turn-helix domain-containing protein [Bacillus thuringiensis]|uniref:helix-turn-helix domain-containing protein n=1 Tax=Bacillus thuringiensis TaxID=1428 RepID=UPI0037CCC235
MLENIIGVEEAADILGLSPGTVKNKCAAGELPAKKIGKTWVLDKKILEGLTMKIWERKGYTIVEVEHNYDLHAFEIIQNEEVVATITPNTIEDMNQIIEDLNNGEDVNGWEDGMGNTISI